jgi:5-formyltetrahydrofolate cyclo-ligase
LKQNGKTRLRRKLRERRRALSAHEQTLAAQQLTARIIATHWFRASHRIACYLPNDGEIDPRATIDAIWKARKRAFLPVLSQLAHERLWFAEVRPDTQFRRNRYGILEPRVPRRALVRAQSLDLVLLPLVAFDTNRNRLGMGGGYYDKSLGFLRFRQHLRKPHLLGLAYDFQRVAALPTDVWDVPLDGIVSDSAVYGPDG